VLDLDEERRAMIRGMRIALAVWPAFAALDLFNVYALSPGASLACIFAYRASGEVVLAIAYSLARRRDVSASLLATAQMATFFITGVLIALIAVAFGEVNGSYIHGESLVIVVQAVVFSAPFRRAIVVSNLVAVSYPLVMGLAALVRPDIAAQWAEPRAFTRFAASYVFVLGTGLIGAVVSHAGWTARRPVYQARKLGRYRLEAPIGKGGQNEVWLAWDEQLRRDVALKILRIGAGTEADLRRFEREARAASKLSSPHTIRVFDFGASDDGIYYIAMEYLAGADLTALVRDHGPMPPARAARLARQACLSLAEAHDAGIVHRDVKPRNLFVTRVGDDYDALKLLDFGVARQVTEGSEVTATIASELRGTPAYMAPEVCSGQPADAQSDIYSLGATLYFLLTGAPPFEAQSPGALFVAHLTEAPQSPSARRGEALPDELERIVLRCLAKRPEERFTSARELYAALSRCPLCDRWTAEDARAFWILERPQARLGPTGGGDTPLFSLDAQKEGKAISRA